VGIEITLPQPPRVKVMDFLDLFQETLHGSNINNARNVNVLFHPSQVTLQIVAEH
jgi:hypothetical protein